MKETAKAATPIIVGIIVAVILIALGKWAWKKYQLRQAAAVIDPPATDDAGADDDVAQEEKMRVAA